LLIDDDELNEVKDDEQGGNTIYNNIQYYINLTS
jgi:hypothetical protein